MAFRFVHMRKKAKHSVTAQEILARLDKYIKSGIKEPMRLLGALFDRQQQNVSYQEIREAIINGSFDDKAVQQWTATYSDFVINDLVPIWEDAMKAGAAGQPMMDGLWQHTLELNRPQVLDWINQRGAEFVTNVTERQKTALRGLIKEYTYGKYGIDELAKVIRPCVGLTVGQSNAVMRYYDNMKDTMRKEHPRMSQANLEKKCRDQAAKYAERLHRQRSYVIAGTEMAFAYNHGMHESMRQSMRKGLIGPLEKRWITSGDENVCPQCDALNGVQIGFDMDFDFGKHRHLFEGQEQVPPLHPRCGCAVEYIEIAPPVFEPEQEETIAPPEPLFPEEIAPEVERTESYLDNMTERQLQMSRNSGAEARVSAAEKHVAEQNLVSRDEARQQLHDGLETLIEQSDFAIRMDAESLLKALQEGRFKNTHEMGGQENAEHSWVRAQKEQQVFGTPLDTPNADRPVYGLLVPKYDETDSKIVGYYISGPGAQYGSIVVILDKDKVINNSSITLGDSLNYAGMVVGTEANNPTFAGSCQGTKAALPIAELAGASREKTADTLIEMTTQTRGSADDRYVEVQLHGEGSHVVTNISQVHIPQKEVTSGNANDLITKLNELSIPHSVIPDSKSFTTSGADDIIIDSKQFGKKAGKHAMDWGLDPGDPESRKKYEEITRDIIANRDEIRHGEWRGQAGICDFYIKGRDVVVVNSGNYITTLKDGVDNERVKNARK